MLGSCADISTIHQMQHGHMQGVSLLHAHLVCREVRHGLLNKLRRGDDVHREGVTEALRPEVVRGDGVRPDAAAVDQDVEAAHHLHSFLHGALAVTHIQQVCHYGEALQMHDATDAPICIRS